MTERGFSLERASIADLDAIFAVAEASLASPWSRASFADELARPEGVRWVARLDAEVAGFLLGRTQVDELEVLLLAVAPDRRRGGCGSALIGAVLEEARARGVLRVHLEVRAHAEPALACYRSAGFEEVGRRAAYYADGEDARLLTLRLVEEGAARHRGECA